jgi:hypothetical protein
MNRYTKHFALVVVLPALALLLNSCGGQQQSDQKSQRSAATTGPTDSTAKEDASAGNFPVPKQLKGQTLSAKAISLAYSKDQQQADERLKRQTVTIKGQVDHVDAPSETIFLKGAEKGQPLQCIMAGGKSAVQGLDKGQTVTLKGQVYGLVGNIMIKEGKLQQ